jgi:hypothetical protein
MSNMPGIIKLYRGGKTRSGKTGITSAAVNCSYYFNVADRRRIIERWRMIHGTMMETFFIQIAPNTK